MALRFGRLRRGYAVAIGNWVDRSLFPFEPNWFETDRWKHHYVDVGHGEPVVFLHGSPCWSFQYRETIKSLKDSFRCLALDFLGFGLSDKPSSVTYRPERQAEHFAQFMDKLGLKDVSLVLHGFGGPIGLSYALDHPGNVRRVVMMNTWMWPLAGNKAVEGTVKFAQSGLGRYLLERKNHEVTFKLLSQVKEKSKFTKDVRRHYVGPFADAGHRRAPQDYTRAMLQSGPWLQGLWSRRNELKGIPALFLWGMQDKLFGGPALDRWDGVFEEQEVHGLPHTGHFVPEEHGADVVAFIDPFLHDMASWSNTGVVL